MRDIMIDDNGCTITLSTGVCAIESLWKLICTASLRDRYLVTYPDITHIHWYTGDVHDCEEIEHVIPSL
jgi:hypothetical protein